MAKTLKRGTQVVYVPKHANGQLDHPNSEEGFVTRVVPYPAGADIVYCRFWSKHAPDTLRTRSTSEACFADELIVKRTRPQKAVKAMLKKIA